jgi:hypothetical protein
MGGALKNTQMSFYFAAEGLEKKTHFISEMRSIIHKRLSYSLLMETTFLYHKGEKNWLSQSFKTAFFIATIFYS